MTRSGFRNSLFGRGGHRAGFKIELYVSQSKRLIRVNTALEEYEIQIRQDRIPETKHFFTTIDLKLCF